MKIANVAMYHLAVLFFIVIVFASAAYGNNNSLTRFQQWFLTASMYILPLTPIAAVLVVPRLYSAGWQAWQCYGLYFLPIVLLVLFLIYIG